MIHLTPDQMNAGFEVAGATLRAWDCYKLYTAKRFMGGSLWTAFFFFAWGLFNTFFYPSLGQTWSLVAAVLLTAVNGLWISMALFYNRKYKQGLAA
jgi:hypothetical protein